MLKVIQRETGEWDILMDQETFEEYIRVEHQKGYDSGATDAYENAAQRREMEDDVEDDVTEYSIVVQYERQGEVYYDSYYSRRGDQKEAIDAVKKLWHTNNDQLFPGAEYAEFFIKVDDIDDPS